MSRFPLWRSIAAASLLIAILVALGTSIGSAARQEDSNNPSSCGTTQAGDMMGRDDNHMGTPGAGMGRDGEHMDGRTDGTDCGDRHMGTPGSGTSCRDTDMMGTPLAGMGRDNMMGTPGNMMETPGAGMGPDGGMMGSPFAGEDCDGRRMGTPAS